MRFKITINIFLFLSFNFLLIVVVKSQDIQICDSIFKKEILQNSYTYYETTFEDFDTYGNLRTYGGFHKKKKIGQWYYFTNNICDSICQYKNNKRIGKSYYFKNGEIDLITYKNNDKTIDTCYNPKITKEYYLTESFSMDGCSQSAPFYYCNGIHKIYFPFNIVIDKIEDLCLRIGGISKTEYSLKH